ncbi:MAG TPA: ankyrin repeat domain-containing protein [Thermoanaerobaculia bacterium]|nr:ankyrin repeat domain-containing protein [Thermoanaerobaculia bacterium]
MFPNPQEALPLPPHPDLEHYRKLAKALVKSYESSQLRDWVMRWVPPDLTDEVEEFAKRKLDERCALTTAQFVIARSHGFESWPKFARHIDGLLRERSSVRDFEAAADAIVAGDEATLRRLLRDDPKLIRMRSTREHRATLLHYVSANGVEGYRQKSPPNAARITAMLLDAGAEVDAEADVYGGGCTALGLVATSVHPEKAGVAEAVMQLLLDRGASIDHPTMTGSAHSAVVGCLANGRPRAAAFLADRGARLDLEGAAGIGRLDVAEQLLPDATRAQVQNGFLYACEYGHTAVARYLLDHGADLSDQGTTGLTGLHWAVMGGHLEVIDMLLDRGAPLEAVNVYGGTVLETAGWTLRNGDPDIDLVAIFERLLAAGAKLQDGWLAWLDRQTARPPEVKARIAEVLRRYGAAS